MSLRIISLRIVLALFSIFAAASVSATELNVSGQGHVMAVPDMAVLSIQVSAEAADTSSAAVQLSAHSDALIQALSRIGLSSKDIQAGKINIQAKRQYSDGKSTVIGWQVTQPVHATLNDLSKLSQLYTALSGIKSLQTNRVELKFSQLATLQREALALAVEDALANAKTLASAAGLGLPKLKQMSMGSAARPSPQKNLRMASMSDESSQMANINVGEHEIKAQVQATFETLD